MTSETFQMSLDNTPANEYNAAYKFYERKLELQNVKSEQTIRFERSDKFAKIAKDTAAALSSAKLPEYVTAEPNKWIKISPVKRAHIDDNVYFAQRCTMQLEYFIHIMLLSEYEEATKIAKHNYDLWLVKRTGYDYAQRCLSTEEMQKLYKTERTEERKIVIAASAMQQRLNTEWSFVVSR
jgi:hypothetical protein